MGGSDSSGAAGVKAFVAVDISLDFGWQFMASGGEISKAPPASTPPLRCGSASGAAGVKAFVAVDISLDFAWQFMASGGEISKAPPASAPAAVTRIGGQVISSRLFRRGS
jgi:hypothetical protein